MKYMQKYSDEMGFRQNNRKKPTRFDTLQWQGVVKKRA
jgi:hypothetical protein